jgi:hypothetical protein
MKKLSKKNTLKKLTPDLFCMKRSCSNLLTMLEMVFCLFYSVSSFFKELHSQGNYNFPVEWSPYINMTNSKTFSGSKIIQDLVEFLCTTCEADINMIVVFYGDIEKKDKVMLLKYALFVVKVRLKTEKSQNKKMSS